jgi:hypothetical protein
MRASGGVAATCAFLILLVVAARGQDPKEIVQRTVSNDLLERVLGDLKIRYEKSTGKTPNTTFYNLDRDHYKIRLGNHGGKHLWLSATFPKTSLQRINDWNVRAKFSRAVLTRQGDRETAVIETQLDCEAGVTEGIIRQSLKRFDKEVRDFDQFLSQ